MIGMATPALGAQSAVVLHAELPSFLAESVSCQSSSSCVAVGLTIVGDDNDAVFTEESTTDAGTTWQAAPLPSTGLPASSDASAVVACGSGLCVAGLSDPGETSLDRSTTGGTSWTSEGGPSGLGSVRAMACATASTCVAVGAGGETPVVNGARTTDGGRHWTALDLPAHVVYDIACPAATLCLAPSDAGLLVSKDAGATWGPAAHPPAVSTSRVTCAASTNHCIAYSSSQVAATTDGGATWVTGSPPPWAISSIWCASATACTAAGRDASGHPVLATSEDGGATWSPSTGPTTSGFLVSGTCQGSLCVLTGEEPGDQPGIWVAGDGGPWTAASVPPVLGGTTLACANATTCVAGGRGSPTPLIRSSDGGSTWHEAAVPGSGTQVSGASCAGARCLASSGNPVTDAAGAIFSSDGGATWSATTTPPATITGAFACSPALCAATAGAGSDILTTTTDLGQTWTDEPLPSGDQATGLPTCPGSAVCLVPASSPAGPVILRTTDRGAVWSAIAEPAGMAVADIACLSATDCVAVGTGPGGRFASTTSTTGGRLWGAAVLFSGAVDPTSVSCAATGLCLAVGETGTPGTAVLSSSDGGQSWTDPGEPVALSDVGQVDCAGTSCVLIGAGPRDTLIVGY